LEEAEVAASYLHGFGFQLAYQLNTTGFAAEAALRLWTITKKRRYLGLADVCMANLFDNLWLWQCDYGYAKAYQNYFGLFPLRDAPYLAPYEELEAHAKFDEFLKLGGDDVRPSMRLLIAEFQKYSLDRCWYYYPDALPQEALSEKVRNGHLERALAIPLEDLQDGREQSGQVGQEIYGAGLPFVLTARHYMRLAGGRITVYSNYPMDEFSETTGTALWRAVGDARCNAELRVWMSDPAAPPLYVAVWKCAGDVRIPIEGQLSAEGHAVFPIRGDDVLEITYQTKKPSGDRALAIGSLMPFAGRAR